jgi:hypothetical protein
LVITLCNNQLLELLEERLFSNIPGVSSILPSLVAKLKTAKDKFLIASVAASSAKVQFFLTSGNSSEHLKLTA